MTTEPHRDASLPSPATLKLRSDLWRAVRTFFLDRGYIEVETPVHVRTPAVEEHIDAQPVGVGGGGGGYLRTSPELHMKRLLAHGVNRLFQVGPCFRHGEKGPIHNPEFTMLEWYRAGADYRDLIEETRALLRSAAVAVTGTTVLPAASGAVDLAGAWTVSTVAEAFEAHAGWNPVRDFDADRFDVDLVEKVEPALPRDRAVVLIDYPAPLAALARCRTQAQDCVAERWELYLGGMEIANAFGELTDAAEQRRRFEACREARRRRGREAYALDEAFLGALRRGLPDCGGVALGMDRLAMLFAGAATLAGVRAFAGADDGPAS